MDIGLIISLISGAVGGNASGGILKKFDMGMVGNTIAGLVGGYGGMEVLGGMMSGGGGAMEFIGPIISGLVGGGVLSTVGGIVKSMIAK